MTQAAQQDVVAFVQQRGQADKAADLELEASQANATDASGAISLQAANAKGVRAATERQARSRDPQQVACACKQLN